MKKAVNNLKFVYIFYMSALFVLVGTITMYNIFGSTKSYVEDITKNIYIDYLYDITQNISDMIVKSTSNKIYEDLKNSPKLRDKLEQNLQLFISDRYRYVYVIDKAKMDNTEFRFLLDGSKNMDEKSEFEEPYEPLNSIKFEEACRTKKDIYFTQKDAKGVWMTFIKPIVKDNKTQALLVVDFSMQGHHLIDKSLQKLDGSLLIGTYVGIFMFFIIVFFAYVDNKRSRELMTFNEKLEIRVTQEVESNRQKDQQLIQQSRLAQMGEMISMIAHQWRQPLAAISSASATIKLRSMLGKLDKDTAFSLSDSISNYSQHLSTTIDDFRDFFKSNKEKKETTYEELVDGVLGIIEVSINNKNIELVKKFNSKNLFYTYPNELKQVILNLVKNAEDILLEKEIENPCITIETEDNILKVSDNGGGIPIEIMDKVFDPYFSTKLEKNGTGLGLYMSKTIVEEHCNGKLDVYNDEQGAVFIMILNS